MAIQRTPQPKSSKAGWGCLGCGCLIVILLFLVGVGLVGGGCYFLYKEAYSVSSDTAATIPPYTGGEDAYTAAQKKLDAFNQDVAASKSSTLTLTADDINALLNHGLNENADVRRFQPQAFVSLNGSDMRLQACIALDAFPGQLFKGRYVNFDGTTGVSFDSSTKDLNFQLHKIQLGAFDLPDSSLNSMSVSFSQSVNQRLRQNSAISAALQAANTVEIKDGQFVITTK